MSDELFDPYDDSIPIGFRIGTQRLGEPTPPVTDIATKRPTKPAKPKPPKARQRSSRIPKDRRELVSSFLEIAGLAAFSGGFFVIHIWLGLIVAGLCLVLLGVATSFPGQRPRD